VIAAAVFCRVFYYSPKRNDRSMKQKLPKSFNTARVAEALSTLTQHLYELNAEMEDATDKQLIAALSKRVGRKVTTVEFKKAINALAQRP
jgi:hypothetical protein